MSVHGLTRRSNNTVERFHSMIKRKVAKAHPNLFVFVDTLNKIISQKLSDMKVLTSAKTTAGQ
jgi:hypothetical protein